MRIENRVSLWLGNALDPETLDEYVRLRYSEDGDIIPSRLMTDFGIEAYDENFREAEVLPVASSRLQEIFAGFSYEKQITDAYESAFGSELDSKCNAVILLFNYDATIPAGQTAVSDGLSLRYYGAVAYEPSYA